MLPFIGLAHGSRHRETVDAITSLVRVTRKLLGTSERLDAQPAFLDLCSPTLLQASQTLKDKGHQSAIVLPLLFTQAYHARIDTPQALAKAKYNSGLNLFQAGITGMGQEIINALLTRAEEAEIPDECAISLYTVGSNSARANRAVQDLAKQLALQRSGPVTVSFATSSEPRGILVQPRGHLAFLPLFFAPGLLLDRLHSAHASNCMVRIAAPLGDLAAPAIASQYRSASDT